MMFNHNITRLEQIIIASDARSKYEGSNLQAEIKRSLNDALPFCIKCHLKQRRKDGEPYFLHPVRVAAYAEVYIAGVNENEVRNICLLHDVIEDCDITAEDVESRFGDFTAQHVVELTNVFIKKSYPELNRRERKLREHDRLSKCTSLTKQIKMLDKADNLTYTSISRNADYLTESEDLIEKIGDANPEIRQLVLDKIKRFK